MARGATGRSCGRFGDAFFRHRHLRQRPGRSHEDEGEAGEDGKPEADLPEGGEVKAGIEEVAGEGGPECAGGDHEGGGEAADGTLLGAAEVLGEEEVLEDDVAAAAGAPGDVVHKDTRRSAQGEPEG